MVQAVAAERYPVFVILGDPFICNRLVNRCSLLSLAPINDTPFFVVFSYPMALMKSFSTLLRKSQDAIEEWTSGLQQPEGLFISRASEQFLKPCQ